MEKSLSADLNSTDLMVRHQALCSLRNQLPDNPADRQSIVRLLVEYLKSANRTDVTAISLLSDLLCSSLPAEAAEDAIALLLTLTHQPTSLPAGRAAMTGIARAFAGRVDGLDLGVAVQAAERVTRHSTDAICVARAAVVLCNGEQHLAGCLERVVLLAEHRDWRVGAVTLPECLSL